MKVFISSVRKGLEAERDSLPGLIMALGHEPRRFEDFGAQTSPSREACLRGVADSDAYLLLLGPNYGHVFPETGQSATHDEWVAALTKGMPKLVFRKRSAELEPEQERFAEIVGDYRSGNFYGEFDGVVDLQAQVVRALRAIEAQPPALLFSPLGAPIEVRWHEGGDQGSTTFTAWLELHAIPLKGDGLSRRQLRGLPDALVSSLRDLGALAAKDGAETSASDNAVVVELPRPNRERWEQPSEGKLSDVQVHAHGQVSLRWSLPRDSLGSILDPTDLETKIVHGIRILDGLQLLPSDSDVALATGIGGNTSMLAEGRVTGVPRTSASLSISGGGSIRVVPDESVPIGALSRGAEEIADHLVNSLLEEFRRRA